jgi:hypothetical protein
MPLRATRTIGTGDGWDLTDSGIYVPDRAGLDDVRPASIMESPQRQPVGIDLFAGAGGFSYGFKQAARSSADRSAHTKARSPTTSKTSSPSASTAADRGIATCCSTASSKAPPRTGPRPATSCSRRSAHRTAPYNSLTSESAA